jgi:hypothetical protein
VEGLDVRWCPVVGKLFSDIVAHHQVIQSRKQILIENNQGK